jgi:hypothetical protein
LRVKKHWPAAGKRHSRGGAVRKDRRRRASSSSSSRRKRAATRNSSVADAPALQVRERRSDARVEHAE